MTSKTSASEYALKLSANREIALALQDYAEEITGRSHSDENVMHAERLYELAAYVETGTLHADA